MITNTVEDSALFQLNLEISYGGRKSVSHSHATPRGPPDAAWTLVGRTPSRRGGTHAKSNTASKFFYDPERERERERERGARFVPQLPNC